MDALINRLNALSPKQREIAEAKLKAKGIELSKYLNQPMVPAIDAIKPLTLQDHYRVSSAQRRLFVLHQLDFQSTAYNLPGMLAIDGKLEINKLENCFQTIVRRHEMLRTSFEVVNGEPVQKIHPEINLPLEYYEAQEDEVMEIMQRFIRPFNLLEAPLLRIGLIKIQEQKHYFMFDMHHVASDGLSMRLLIKEFTDVYGRGIEEPLVIQYKDYAEWQNQYMESDSFKANERYWLEQYKDEIPVLNFPTDHLRKPALNFTGDRHSSILNISLSRKVIETSQKWGVTLYTLLLSAFYATIYKYTGQEDVVIGTPVSGRTHLDVQKLIGMFVNTLAIRIRPNARETNREFVQNVKMTVMEAFENQDYPFESLVEALSIKRDLSRNPLFDFMFVLQHTVEEELNIEGLRFSPVHFENKTSKLDLTLSASVQEDRIKFDFEYRLELFEETTIHQLAVHFVHVLQTIIERPENLLSEINLLGVQEERKVLQEYNDTLAIYPQSKMIHQLFEEQVKKSPGNIAVIDRERTLTYKELNDRSNRLGKLLREKEVGPGVLVAVMMERSFEMIISIMGILKAGGAYVPISPSFPHERKLYMLRDSGVGIILVTREQPTDGPEFHMVETIYLNADDGCNDDDSNNLIPVGSPRDLAYVIYTSGSTGEPKGTMIEHHSIVNRLWWMQTKYPIGEGDTILHKTPFTFDVSVWELLWWSITGARMSLLSPGGEKEPSVILDTIRNDEVTVLHFVPSMLSEFMEKIEQTSKVYKLRSLKHVFVSGEALQKWQVERFYKGIASDLNIQFSNLYGPTEATVDVTSFDLERNIQYPIIPIGKPISNIQMYVLGKDGRPQPVGIPGELYIAGEGLARGYLNRAELTLEKFVPNPWIPGERMYRTGDLAKWLPDGNLAYLGRMDDQVKIRGYRIEIGEVEGKLQAFPGVKEIVVTVTTDSDGNRQLCAYYTGDTNITAALREHVAKVLPEYMIPGYFVRLEELPLTANGKIAKKMLPAPEEHALDAMTYVAPADEMERRLEELWAEVLHVEHMGTRANFFEIGGHSLRAASLISKIHHEFQVELSLRDLFQYRTIQEQAKQIRALAGRHGYQSIMPAAVREHYPLSAAQKRLFILHRLDEQGTGYNMPAALRLEGRIDLSRLETTFRELIRRHESLRTTFELIDGEPVQRIHPEVPFALERIEPIPLTEAARQWIRPFKLTEAPLFRAGVIEEEGICTLVVDMHHIVSDGISVGILLEEFVQLYQGITLPPLSLQYKDFAVWQNTMAEQESLRLQKSYWIHRLQPELPVLNLPTDFPRPSERSSAGDSVSFRIGRELTDRLRQQNSENDTTLFMILLASYTVLLSKYTAQEDIIVGCPIAGRRHDDVSQMVGMFVNTLALRNFPDMHKTFRSFLSEVRNEALGAFQNQDLPFEEVVNLLSIERDMSRNPVFDTIFSFQNKTRLAVAINGLFISNVNLDTMSSQFDLGLTALETDHGVDFYMEYSTELFSKHTISKMTQHYVRILEIISSRPDIVIADIDMLSSTEFEKLIIGNNLTDSYYSSDLLISERFEMQASITPDRIAVTDDNGNITYKMLNEKADRLANKIRNWNSEDGQTPIIGIWMDRSIDMIVAILAVLKAGGAYLPILPQDPEERVRYILLDSGAKLLLTDRQSVNLPVPILNPQSSREEMPIKKVIPSRSKTLDDAAYVIYTSGTQGFPKGVIVTEGNLRTYLHAFLNEFPLQENDVVLAQAPLSFDAFVEEMYPILIRGGQVVIFNRDFSVDPQVLAKKINDHRVSMISCSPLLLNELNQIPIYQLRTLHTAISGGDQLKASYVSNLVKHMKVYNSYGPTEATVCCTYYQCNFDTPELVPIGKPISNYKVYVLGKEGRPQPVGIPGELCIAGEGLARGYLNRAELTLEKFVPNPWIPGERMYRTGDLAKWLPDGNLAYLGRMDDQVKIRGYRIEIGEVEGKLQAFPGVKEIVVTVTTDSDGNRQLCAYYTGDTNITAALREHVAKVLPEYMIPGYFVRLEELPLTANGKIAKKMLPAPEEHALDAMTYVAPADEMERRLEELWAEVLHVEHMGTRANFFEIGGHSLRAASLISKIHHEFQVELSLRDLFQYRTIQEQAKQIRALAGRHGYQSIMPAAVREHYPLSAAQKRLFILHRLDEQGTGYNMPAALRLEGRIDLSRLETTFRELIRRHESLRTTFELIDGEPVQRIHPEVPFALERIEPIPLTEAARQWIRPFKLTEAPLFRAGVIEEEGICTLVVDMHHIVSDGISVGILLEEFVQLYQGITLPPLSLQYKDFTVWRNFQYKTENRSQAAAYWKSTFDIASPALELPTDYTRPAYLEYSGDKHESVVPVETVLQLKRLANDKEVTLSMLLFSAFNVLLHCLTQQDDIIVGVTSADRPVVELQGVIGMFVNAIPIRSRVQRHLGFSVLLEQTKQLMLKAIENQNYPLEDILGIINWKRDESRNPLFDVMFNMQNMEKKNIYDLSGSKSNLIDLSTNISKFDMTLYISETENGLSLQCTYRNRLFNKSTIASWMDGFSQVLAVVCENPDILLCDIALFKNSLLNIGNNPKKIIETNGGFTSLTTAFDAQADRLPDRVAVRARGRGMTYQELKLYSDRLAYALLGKGMSRTGRVSLLFEHEAEMIIALLGVLKSGYTYVPINPSYPEHQLERILDDSQTDYIITTNHYFELADRLRRHTGSSQVILLEEVNNEAVFPEHLSMNPIHPTQPAYLLYTSGSTGRPKGVVQSHGNVLYFIREYIKRLQITEEDRLSMFSSYNHDAGIVDIFSALLSGACLCLYDLRSQGIGTNMEEWMKEERITIYHSVPTVYRYFLSALTRKVRAPLRYIVLGGEQVTPSDVGYHRKYFDARSKFVNLLGSSEVSITMMNLIAHDYNLDSRFVPLGTPIEEMQVLIVNGEGQQVDCYEIGELVYASPHAAIGYWNLLEETHKVFVEQSEMGRMYKSGDLARLHADGRVEFIGRKDNMIKIRGYRVDPGEIEAIINSFSEMELCAITASEQDNEPILSVYYQLKSNQKLSPKEIKNRLEDRVPYYMIPSVLRELPTIPLTANGKVDRQALPEIESFFNETEVYLEPTTEMERIMSEICKDILGIKAINMNANFQELGGHSLKIMQIIAKLSDLFEIDLPYSLFFQTKNSFRFIAAAVQENLVLGKKESTTLLTSQEVILLNEKKEHNVFAFPPIGAYGFSYHEFALHITDYSFYAFDYFEDSNKVEKYVQSIESLQPAGPYILLGYSLGGFMAFEVARELIRKGKVVSKVIMLDSRFNDQINRKNNLNDEVETLVTDGLKYYASIDLSDKQIDFLKKNIAKKVQHYSDYIANCICRHEKIPVDIFFIQSQDSKENAFKRWIDLTNHFELFQGSGNHLDLISRPHVEENAEIVMHILKE
ncbi:non-ribosomal peptide synthetase [Paenibacillus dendritiformis]|uniref:non-ribosomal peptide synthetase n=1 Tax=Paenibacillus dendritiformis TaxID=130049 RepID=UPI00387E1DEA